MCRATTCKRLNCRDSSRVSTPSCRASATEQPIAAAGPEKPTAAQIKKSVTHDGIISFEDGKTYKTMRRHLTLRGLTPEAYRAKYGLPADYPMTSAAYSAQRSELARSLGLGNMRRKAAPKAAEGAETVSEPPKTRGRSSKTVEGSRRLRGLAPARRSLRWLEAAQRPIPARGVTCP